MYVCTKCVFFVERVLKELKEVGHFFNGIVSFSSL